MPVIQHLLQNKAVLIAEPVAGVKTAAIGFWFSAGSRYEAENERGISHFVEHLLFKGTASRSAFDIARAFDRIGGYVNAFTDRENICVYCVVPAQHAGFALDVMCDMTVNSRISETDIARERSVIENEIISSLDDPEEAALDAVAEAVWGNHPIALNIAGSVQSVRKLTHEQLYGWYQKYIAGAALTVCVSGNIDAESIKRRLELLPPGKNSAPGEAGFEPVTWNAGVRFIKAPFQQEQFFLLYPLPFPVSARRNAVLNILNALVGDTMSSRLFQRLREQSGYCYNVYSFFSIFSDCGFWCAYASASPKQAVNAVSDLCSEISRLFAEDITEDEILGAKQHLCGEELILSEDVEQRVKRLARNYFFGFDQCNTDSIIETIQSITKEELIAELHAVLRTAERSLVVYGPQLHHNDMKKIKMRFEADE